jgi:hypothetical protein
MNDDDPTVRIDPDQVAALEIISRSPEGTG